MKPMWERKSEREIPQAVLDSVRKEFGHDSKVYLEALRCLRWDGLNGCWCLGHAGMYIGIEESDGYMHT